MVKRVNDEKSDIILDDTIKAIVEMQTQEIVKAFEKNSECQGGNEEEADFGLVPGNPIYTYALKSVDGEKEYLDKLCAENGEKITWNRKGSIQVEGINGMVDIYDTYLSSGQLFKTIYINMYGKSTSNRIPIGFSLKSADTEEKKTEITENEKVVKEKQGNKINGIHIVIFVLIGIALFVGGYCLRSIKNNNLSYEKDDIENMEIIETKASTDKKYPLYKKAKVLVSDPSGLSNKYNVIGENIIEVLNGYEEGKDYTVKENEYFCAYTLAKEVDYWWEQKAKITIYTDAGEDIITMVEYSIKTDWQGRAVLITVIEDIKEELTDYYDAEPQYSYMDDFEIIDTTRTEFEHLFGDGYKAIYHISWEGENGNVMLTMQNLYDEKGEEWTISFTE